MQMRCLPAAGYNYDQALVASHVLLGLSACGSNMLVMVSDIGGGDCVCVLEGRGESDEERLERQLRFATMVCSLATRLERTTPSSRPHPLVSTCLLAHATPIFPFTRGCRPHASVHVRWNTQQPAFAIIPPPSTHGTRAVS